MDLTEPQRVITSLTEAERTLALERFRSIQPFLDDGVQLAVLADQGGPSIRTARRWIKSYREAGLVGLAKTKRGDAGLITLLTSLIPMLPH